MENKQNDKDQILAQWLNGEISAEEAKALLNHNEFIKYLQIVEEIETWIPDTDQQIFDTNTILNQKREAKTIQWTNWKYISIAAAILLAIFASPILWQTLNTTTYQTAYGESQTILLPDGTSKVILGPNAKLSLNRRGWKSGKRKVDLQGKAYIEVPTPGSFEVETSTGSVSVLGTRFEVYQFEQSLHAVCYEGKVRASTLNGQSLTLSKGESSLALHDRWGKKMHFNRNAPNWLKDRISFDNAPLKMVLDEITSTYGLKIDLGNINLARRFTGSIPNNQLDQTLKIVFPTLGISYRLDGKTLYLSE